jgi:hypothetical protein
MGLQMVSYFLRGSVMAHLPECWEFRWSGTLLAYFLVVPAILETADLIDTSGLIKNARVKPLGWKKNPEVFCGAAGLVLIALALFIPGGRFFQLIWGAFALLLDPLNERMGAPSFLGDWREGKTNRLAAVGLAGVLYGGFWAVWGHVTDWSWIHGAPWLGVWRGENPVLGWASSPLFALQSYTAAVTTATFWNRAAWRGRIFYVAVVTALLVILCRMPLGAPWR